MSVDETTKKKVLIVSYVSPEMSAPVSNVIIKHLKIIKMAGYDVDIATVDFSKSEFLLSLYKFDKNNQLLIKNLVGKQHSIKFKINFLSSLLMRLGIFDLMSGNYSQMFKLLSSMNIEQYDMLVSFSPFFSINRVIENLKNKYAFKWLAYFCDPWFDNPIKSNFIQKFVAKYAIKKMLAKVDAVAAPNNAILQDILSFKSSDTNIEPILIPHFYCDELYPKENHIRRETIILRFIGTFFENRNAHNVLQALVLLNENKPDLLQNVKFEIVGNKTTHDFVKNDPCFPLLRKELIGFVSQVDYLDSLVLMRCLDGLVLIESEVLDNKFVPSKFSDYIGSGTPILGIMPKSHLAVLVAEISPYIADYDNIEDIANKFESFVCDIKQKNIYSQIEQYIPNRTQYNTEKPLAIYSKIMESL